MSVDRLTDLSVVAKAAVPLNCLILIPGNLGNGTLGQTPATRFQIKLSPSRYLILRFCARIKATVTLASIQTAPRSIPVMGGAMLDAAQALVGAKVLYTGVDSSHGGEKNDPVGVW